MAGKATGMRIGAVLLLSSVLAACGGGGGSSPSGTEFENLTAEQIYRQGEVKLETGKRPADALVYFQEIERLYPYTEYAKRALIMQAFVLHKTKKYEEARAAAQRYLDFYPGDEDAAYAQYLLALSYYDQIDDVGRDQGLTYQALQAMRDVIELYPDSEYAQSAMLKFDLAFDHLAAKEMEIGRYYLKRKNYTAALNRFRSWCRISRPRPTPPRRCIAGRMLPGARLRGRGADGGGDPGLQLPVLALLSGQPSTC
jgi:outer membrane protein assembly factor BamD